MCGKNKQTNNKRKKTKQSPAQCFEGVGTILSDNPSLTTRLVKGENARPIIFDTNLRIGLDAKVLTARSVDERIKAPCLIMFGKTEKMITAERIKKKDQLASIVGVVLVEVDVEEETGKLDLALCFKVSNGRHKVFFIYIPHTLVG